MAGKLVVIEGMDGAGTTTQTQKLKAHLQSNGYRVLSSAEPTGSELGMTIRKLLSMPLEKEPDLLASLALCFAADRMQHIHSIIRPALKENDFVVLDRYVLSSLVYQGLHLPTTFVKEINRYILKPDLTIVLDVDVKIAEERLSLRASTKDFFESKELLKKIKSRYLHFAHDDINSTVLVDASGGVDRVHSHIVNVISDKLL